MPQTITLKIPANIASQVITALEQRAANQSVRYAKACGTPAAAKYHQRANALEDLAENLQRLLTEHVNAQLADMPDLGDSFGGDPWVDDEPGLHAVRQDREI